MPVVRVAGTRLFFGLGAFGVSYEGVLSEDETRIRGTWTQGGVGSPLELARASTAP